ncbi:MAG TPA: AMP-binding protein [Candidatus Acidoferrales bacterium]|nr:AMP-binding protein [Candidatus Acidoferrales bacterium]
MLEPLVRERLPRLQHLYDRVPTPARHLLTSARGWVLTRLRYSRKTFAILDDLQGHETWTSTQIAEHQLEGLRRTLTHAIKTVPFYANYPRAEIHSLDDFRRLPVIDRETVLDHQEQLVCRAVPANRLIRAGTTGTTGASLRVAYSEDLARRNWAFLLRQRAWANVSPREPRVTFQGPRIVPAQRSEPPYWTYNLPEHQVLMSIFHLSEGTAPSYLEFLMQHRGEVLEGFPSVLGILADFAMEAGIRIPMRAIFTSGEPLYPELRSKIEAAFAVGIFDTYGMTEYCGLIQECEQGQMHLAPEYGFLEVLDQNGNQAKPGEEGYFVWTGFLNAAMPLVRYRIGDRGRWHHGAPCRCGRAFPLVVPTITRESDILRCPDGRLYSARALNQLLKRSTSFRCCQFVHDRAHRVVVRAVAREDLRKGNTADDLMRIRGDLQELLGTSMQVTAEIAARPIVRRGGKIPLIVDEVAVP